MPKFKLYIKDSERNTDPAPMVTNAKLVITVGLVVWLLALAVLLVFYPEFCAEQPGWPYTCVCGIGLGLYGFFHVSRR